MDYIGKCKSIYINGAITIFWVLRVFGVAGHDLKFVLYHTLLFKTSKKCIVSENMVTTSSTKTLISYIRTEVYQKEDE